jgi:hypothetical protein
MSRAQIEIGNTNVDLELRPIEPSWIIEGNPVSHSHMILEGSIVLESDGMPPKRYGAGDVIFFRDGAHAKWHVQGYVKKIAFCRKTNPAVIGFMVRVVNKLKRMLLSPGERRPASLMSTG